MKLDGWKPSEKCYRCEDLTVTFEDGMKFGCGRLERKPLVVPYLLVQLWDRNKDAIRAEKPECGKPGYPVVKTATVRKGVKTYTYKQQWFGHYSSERFKSGRLHMVFCYIPKAKKEKKVKSA